MWNFARKNWKTNIAFQGGRTTRFHLFIDVANCSRAIEPVSPPAHQPRFSAEAAERARSKTGSLAR
jgi:hypothetical protein